jgi:hypothetical protein
MAYKLFVPILIWPLLFVPLILFDFFMFYNSFLFPLQMPIYPFELSFATQINNVDIYFRKGTYGPIYGKAEGYPKRIGII